MAGTVSFGTDVPKTRSSFRYCAGEPTLVVLVDKWLQRDDAVGHVKRFLAGLDRLRAEAALSGSLLQEAPGI